MKLYSMLIFNIIIVTLCYGIISCTEEEYIEYGTTYCITHLCEQGFCEPNNESFPIRPDPQYEATLSFLHVEGTQIKNESGITVALRGVNFGSWLMMETWIAGIGIKSEGDLLDMIPVKAQEYGVADIIEEAQNSNHWDWVFETKSHWNCIEEWREYSYEHVSEDLEDNLDDFWAWFDSEPWIYEEQSLWNWLEKRFGYEKMLELRNTFADNYITEIDVQRVAELGLNLIRLPVWYDALESDYKGVNFFKKEGWERLDNIVNWARKYGVYIMLDLHGTPGGQSTSWHQGLPNGGVLWEREDCISKTTRLWKAIANYFKDEPHIAVYNLMNEPMSAPDRSTYETVHNRIYEAIREVDTNHIVMNERGYKLMSAVASPEEMGWENAMFSIHSYPTSSTGSEYLSDIEGEITGLASSFNRFNCPIFLGEFNAADGTDSESWAAQTMGEVFEMLNNRGVHWAPWTWKYYDDLPTWGLYHPISNPGYKINVKDASFEQIKSDFQATHSNNFTEDPTYAQSFMDHADTIVSDLDLN